MMIKEYIIRLAEDNQNELLKLEDQMRALLDELTYAQEWHESLQKENNSQNNIFSPRSIHSDFEQNLEKSQLRISKINQQIEYTREMIETHLKKKTEYIKMMNELEENPSDNENDSSSNNNKTMDEKEVKELLNDIYRKTEVSLALLNTNKNRCKVELNEIKKIIKDFAANYGS